MKTALSEYKALMSYLIKQTQNKIPVCCTVSVPFSCNTTPLLFVPASGFAVNNENE